MTGTALFPVAAIRALEAGLQRGLAPGQLMTRAATAVAEEAGRMLRTLPAPARVALLVGPGNNGGDALLAGLQLAGSGYRVVAFGVDAVRRQSPKPIDAAQAWQQWQPRPIVALAEVAATIATATAGLDAGLDAAFDAAFDTVNAARARTAGPMQAAARHAPGWLIIDGLFGIGLARRLDHGFATLFAALHDLRQRHPGTIRLLAIDVPSGLDADRGAPAGGLDAPLLAADATVTMIADKPGLRTGAGMEAAGRIRVAALRGAALGDDRAPPDGTDSDGSGPAGDAGAAGHRIDAATAATWIPRRRIDSHKGRHGDLLVVGGRLGMHGAARLAARGALAAGAGKVSIVHGTAGITRGPGDARAQPRKHDGDDDAPADPVRPEIMRWDWRPAGLARFDAVIVGCGLGLDAPARRWLRAVLEVVAPLVVDADALTLAAVDRSLADAIRGRAARAQATVLTPHPLEAARLLGCATSAIQEDRIGAAIRLASRLQAVVVLKGAGTVIADASGHWAVNGSGGPVLATAGTGDVLAGIIGALTAQLPPATAACLGAWAHGAAGDEQAARSGDRGSPAASLADRLPRIWRSGVTAAAAAASHAKENAS